MNGTVDYWPSYQSFKLDKLVLNEHLHQKLIWMILLYYSIVTSKVHLYPLASSMITMEKIRSLRCMLSSSEAIYLFYSAVVAFGFPGFIHANAEAPPTGFDDLGIVAILRGAFCSSELTVLDSHLKGTFSCPPT
jgi:hypothetical protein